MRKRKITHLFYEIIFLKVEFNYTIPYGLGYKKIPAKDLGKNKKVDYIAFDFETTGLDWKNGEIVEIHF